MIEPRHNRSHPTPWMELFLATKGWFALIAGVALLAFTLFSVNNYRTAKAFETSGEWMTAEITAMRIRRGDDNDDYLVTFAYDVAGRSFERQRDTGRSYYRAHSIGDAVQIKILPQRPEKFEYSEGQTHTQAKWMQIIAGIAGLVGCGVLWRSGSKANSGVLARKLGVRTTATIDGFVDIKNSGKPTGQGYMMFRTKDGLRGQSLNADIRTLRALGRETEIVVFVRGKDVWWEGDVGPRAERQSEMPVVPRDW